MKEMNIRYAGACRLCGASLQAGTKGIYENETKTIRCLACATEAAVEAIGPDLEPPRDASLSTESGVAGSSARREYERRKAKDEEKLREKWGYFGDLAVALSDERPHTKSWDRGAIGEERLGSRLNALAADGLAVLHDRRISGSKVNIDHVVVTPGWSLGDRCQKIQGTA